MKANEVMSAVTEKMNADRKLSGLVNVRSPTGINSHSSTTNFQKRYNKKRKAHYYLSNIIAPVMRMYVCLRYLICAIFKDLVSSSDVVGKRYTDRQILCRMNFSSCATETKNERKNSTQLYIVSGRLTNKYQQVIHRNKIKTEKVQNKFLIRKVKLLRFRTLKETAAGKERAYIVADALWWFGIHRNFY